MVLLFALLPASGRCERLSSVTSAVPHRRGEELVCLVGTTGVPDSAAARSMEGGLPSSIDFRLLLLDDKQRALSTKEFTFRVAFDLWEEVFRVDGPTSADRFATLDEVRSYFGAVGPLPVAPWNILERGVPYTIEVEMVRHTIAPAQAARLGEWIAGDRSGVTGDPDEREVSFGLGRMIRFFFNRERHDGKDVRVARSDPFRPEEVGDGSP